MNPRGPMPTADWRTRLGRDQQALALLVFDAAGAHFDAAERLAGRQLDDLAGYVGEAVEVLEAAPMLDDGGMPEVHVGEMREALRYAAVLDHLDAAARLTRSLRVQVDGSAKGRQRLHEAELLEARHEGEAQVAALAAADRAPPDHDSDGLRLALLAADGAEQHEHALPRRVAAVV